ncbi:MAG: hypothetical protein AAFV07_00450 [Bacteroidota bacterium]
MLRWLRHISLYSLIVLYAAVVFRPLWPCVDYAVHQQYFAEVLCPNKDRPELKCQGKCVLMQKIQAAQQEPQSPDAPVPISVEDFLSLLFWEADPASMFGEPQMHLQAARNAELAPEVAETPPTPPPRA